MIIVTSWDDGHPLDQRVGELLAKYSLAGTFYVPVRNSEGLPVMTSRALRDLSDVFEVGAHTFDHLRLPGLGVEEITRQVRQGKDYIEQQIGRAVPGFCYPGGARDRQVQRIVRDAGFCYARTVENLCVDWPRTSFDVPTTLQFFPHPSTTLVKNYIRYGRWTKKSRILKLALSTDWRLNRVAAIAEAYQDTNDVIHLWGHSWELDKLNLWASLDQLLSTLASHKAQPLTVLQAYRYLSLRQS